MKKTIALSLAVIMMLAFAGCGEKVPAETTAVTTAPADTTASESTAAAESTAAQAAVNTHEEFISGEVDTQYTVETAVQAKQGWWEKDGQGVATIYTQAEDGAYFLYEVPCTKEEYDQLTEGTMIRVTGYKTEWEGEVELADCTFEIIDGNYIAEPLDVTDLLASEDLIAHQNEKISVSGMTVKKIEYKNGEPGDDIYLTVSHDDAEYTFCVEAYLTGPDTDVYKSVADLKEGDTVDMEGFLYWYKGANPHVTSITVK